MDAPIKSKKSFFSFHRFINLAKSIYTNPVRFFVFHAILIGILSVIIVPPFQAPDEPSHFEHAYQISQGIMTERRVPVGLGMGGVLPKSVLNSTIMTAYMIGDMNKKYTTKVRDAEWNLKLNPTVTTPIPFPDTATYAPTAYAPAAVIIYVGRHLNLSPVILLYLARLAGLIVFIVAGYFAVKIMPFRKWLFVLLLCVPMTLVTSAGLNVETMLRASVMLLVALFFLIKTDSEKLDNPLYILGLALTAVILATTKETYLPLALLPGVLLLDKTIIKDRKKVLTIASILVVTLASWGVWFIVVSHLNVPPINADPSIPTTSQAIKNIKGNIPQFIAINANTLVSNNSSYYLISFIGNFGYLDTLIPFWMLFCFYLILFLYAFKRESPKFVLSGLERLIIFSLGAIAVGLTFGALYVIWTTPNYTYISGLQGRYFWPVALVVIGALPAGFLVFKTHALKVVYSGLLIICMVIIAYRYYLLPSPFVRVQTEPNKYIEMTRFYN